MTDPTTKLAALVDGLEKAAEDHFAKTNGMILVKTEDAKFLVSAVATLKRERDEAVAALEPRGWFVKDFADGWIYFDTEADALREVEATGAIMLVGHLPLPALSNIKGENNENRL